MVEFPETIEHRGHRMKKLGVWTTMSGLSHWKKGHGPGVWVYHTVKSEKIRFNIRSASTGRVTSKVGQYYALYGRLKG